MEFHYFILTQFCCIDHVPLIGYHFFTLTEFHYFTLMEFCYVMLTVFDSVYCVTLMVFNYIYYTERIVMFFMLMQFH